MRFGKRRSKEAFERDASVEAPPAPDEVPEGWLATQPGAAGQESLSMPPPDSGAPGAPPVVEPEPPFAEPEADAVFEGEAVELPYEPPAAAEPPAAPAAPWDSEPAASQPAFEAPPYHPPAPHPVKPEPAARLADSTSHHEPGINSSSGGAWPEPAFDLAERPEILVGAAFGGGLLLALILRRFGH